MEKSIENIWNQGFLNNEALIAPKINKLYETKSIHTIEKFKSLYHKNFWFVVILMVVNFFGAWVYSNIYIGTFLGALFIPILVLSRKQIKVMDLLDQNQNSYTYVKTFDAWLKQMISEFGRFYRYFYPMYFLGVVSALAFSPLGDENNETFYDKLMVSSQVFKLGGIPIIWVTSVVVIAGLIAYFTPQIFRFDIRSVYGRLMDRLESILTEMEELRK